LRNAANKQTNADENISYIWRLPTHRMSAVAVATRISNLPYKSIFHPWIAWFSLRMAESGGGVPKLNLVHSS